MKNVRNSIMGKFLKLQVNVNAITGKIQELQVLLQGKCL